MPPPPQPLTLVIFFLDQDHVLVPVVVTLSPHSLFYFTWKTSNLGSMPKVWTPCPKFGHLPVKLKTLFFARKKNLAKMLN